MTSTDGRLPCAIDDKVLSDPANEETSALLYWLNAVGHLLNVLDEYPRLRKSPLHGQLLSIMRFWATNPQERDKAKAKSELQKLASFAPVGKALWYLDHEKDPQLRLELERLATDPESLVGNQFLFYLAGTLAAQGHALAFVPEKGKHGQKTPDLCAEKNGKEIWIEANAKQPKRTVDTPERLWQLIRDVIAEKKQKFSDPAYSPGMIVADVSPAHQLASALGTAGRLKLRADLCRPLPPSSRTEEGFLYRLSEDPEWELLPENQNNVFSYVAREFAEIDRAKYHVSQCLMTVTREVWHGVARDVRDRRRWPP
jgi:hypothetical protein